MQATHRARGLFMVIAAVVLIAPTVSFATPSDAPTTDAEQVAMDTLVSTEWLSRHLDDPDLVVLDCTVRVSMEEDGGYVVASGRAEYEAGHIPTAGFADLTGELRDSDSPLEYGLPTPEKLAAAMGALGVGDDSRVVLYDAGMSVWAARVWWMLRWIGFERAAILDGGLSAWKAEGRPLSTEPPDRTARTLTPDVRPELIADRDEVFAAIDDEAVRIIDVMPEAHYRGEMSMYGRPGHIPTAVNRPVTTLLDESSRFRPHDELAAMHDGDRDLRAITYCGGGIAASGSAFVMTRLGFDDVAVYIGSLQEWAGDPANPLEVETP